jgi:hypothetical protein
VADELTAGEETVLWLSQTSPFGDDAIHSKIMFMATFAFFSFGRASLALWSPETIARCWTSAAQIVFV